jgi:hypothetical protein
MTGDGDAPPDRDAAQMRASVEGARRQIAASVVALQEEARLALSWREWFRRRPALFVGVAFAVGFLAGGARRR